MTILTSFCFLLELPPKDQESQKEGEGVGVDEEGSEGGGVRSTRPYAEREVRSSFITAPEWINFM